MKPIAFYILKPLAISQAMYAKAGDVQNFKNLLVLCSLSLSVWKIFVV